MEILDIYDTKGEITGKTVIRGNKSLNLTKDEHIPVAVIFI